MRHAVILRAGLVAGIMLRLALPAQLAAQHHGGDHTGDHAHDSMLPSPPARGSDVRVARLGGQAAFATMAEVIRMLEADPATDWRAVDLERLRAHLVDMDAVTLRAAVTREDIAGGARFTIRGDAATMSAARRLATAHAGMLRAERRWEMAVADADGALRVTVMGPPGDATAAPRIRALGFVGLLTTGDHHPAHHVAIARGTLDEHH